MIITVNKRSLLRFFAVAFLGVIAAGIFCYISPPLPQAVADRIPVRDPDRYYREHALFIALTAVLVMVPCAFRLLKESRNLSKELTHIINLTRMKEFSPDSRLKHLGEIGQLIATLYFELNRLSEQKSVKISGQSNLIAFLTENLEKPVIITDHAGIILHTSDAVLAKWETTRTALAHKDLNSLITGVPVHDLLQDVYNQYRSVDFEYRYAGEDKKGKAESGKGILQPVMNSQKDLAYAVWLFSNIPFKKLAPQLEPQKQGKRISDFFNRMRKQMNRK
ncbi:MAG: hypothetical protein JXB03_01850 [Spirochaetales bacterium]|nr:hypothetical protein [Spirochaetales bacterium]